MNIWILNHYAITPDTAGGTRHFDFAQELIKKGHKVSIFASSFSHRIRIDSKLNKREKYIKENVRGVDFYWVKTSHYHGGNDWRRIINMLSYFHNVILLGMKLIEKPSIILASSPHLFTGLAGCILAKIRRARFVFEVRDLWPQTLVEIGGYSNSSVVVKLLRILEKFLYHRAERIIVLMPRAVDYITKLGVPRNNIVWIPNGISPDRFAASGNQLSGELDKMISDLRENKKVIVGYTGAHGLANTLDTLLIAVQLLQKRNFNMVHFILVGEGPEKNNLVEKARAFGLSNVTFFKAIPKDNIPALLGSIDIAVLPRRKSGLGKFGISTNKLFDYLASAKPVVWSTNSINNPVADANCGITVEPENPEALANAIIKMCGLSAEERREMGMRGYDYVMKYHSVPILVNKLIDVLETSKK